MRSRVIRKKTECESKWRIAKVYIYHRTEFVLVSHRQGRRELKYTFQNDAVVDRNKRPLDRRNSKKIMTQTEVRGMLIICRCALEDGQDEATTEDQI
jgi:hypothetical protein